MRDESLYVRKCCGPFVVGYLGYTYPDTTIPWLRAQARLANLNVRANVAKAFSQALGGNYPEEALKILASLAEDDRPRVQAAVAASIRNIVRRRRISKRALRSRYPKLVSLAYPRDEPSV
jgi:hypothetical protein